MAFDAVAGVYSGHRRRLDRRGPVPRPAAHRLFRARRRGRPRRPLLPGQPPRRAAAVAGIERGPARENQPGRPGRLNPMSPPKPTREGPVTEPFWYKSGVIYELHVRAFYDADGDGTGDFR